MGVWLAVFLRLLEPGLRRALSVALQVEVRRTTKRSRRRIGLWTAAGAAPPHKRMVVGVMGMLALVLASIGGLAALLGPIYLMWSLGP